MPDPCSGGATSGNKARRFHINVTFGKRECNLAGRQYTKH
jgi:hypothetical protein